MERASANDNGPSGSILRAQRAHGSRYERVFAGGFACQTNTRLVDGAQLFRQPKSAQPKTVAAERIGFEDFGARRTYS